MNKSAKYIPPVLLLFLAGCASTMPGETGADPELTCGSRTVTVYQARGFLAVYPEYIDVCRGETITFRAVPRISGGSIRTAPDRTDKRNPGRDDWLRSDGGATEAAVSVPRDATLGVYKYAITVDGVGTLDPRARVVR
jgi:hypothetical protein